MTAVFANIFRFDIKSFPAYYLTGSMIFNFFIEATNNSMGSIIGAGGLIKKVYIPKYIFPLEKCLFAFVNMLFSLFAVAVVFIITKVDINWTIILFPIPMLYTFMFALGMGLFLSALNLFFRDTEHLYGVLTTAWMFLTPIIYPISILPQTVANYMPLNPMYHYVTYARNVMIYGEIPGFTENVICVAFAFLSLVFGLYFFKRKQDKFILYL
jgi:ABC-2 type transport system permease protein